MILLFLFPIILTTVLLYLFLTLFGNSFLIWLTALICSAIGSVLFLRNNFNSLKTEVINSFNSINKLIILTPLILLVVIFSLVISPLVVTKKLNNFEHVQITLGDHYKHTFVVTMLKKDGIPPKNPYFPSTYLSYYYGYYLIPAAISKTFLVQPNFAFYLYTILVYTIGLICIYKIILDKIKGFWFRLLSTLLLVTASGVDVFSQIIEEFNPIHQFINPGILSNGQIFALINNYKALVYVPQHFFPALVLISFMYLLLKDKSFSNLNEYKKIIAIILFSTYIFLSSTFVAMTLIFWLALIFIFIKRYRKSLIISGFLSGLILTPYLIFLSNRSNLFFKYNFIPFQIVEIQNTHLNFLLNSLLTFIIKYGPLLLLLPVLIFFKGIKFVTNNFLYIIALLLPFIITWFIRTPIYNDFSMRTSIPIQIILPVIFIGLLQTFKNKALKTCLIVISICLVIFGTLGWYLEYSRHWRNRLILHPKDSEYLLTIRNYPDEMKFISFENERWVELTPSIGFKKILSPHLFDSYVYFSDNNEGKHSKFERLAKEIFLEENIASDTSNLIKDKNTHLNNLSEFLGLFPSDKLILPNQLWVKEDINPWLAIFKEMDVKIEPLTSHFSLVDYQDLLNISKNYKIYVDSQKPQQAEIEDHKFHLQKGFWYLSTCNKTSGNKQISLELEDYYLVFSKELDTTNRCQGKIFYLPETEDVRIMHSSNVENIIVHPMVLLKKD